LDPDAHYLAVRGPYTRDAVLKAGGECEEVYGDPGIILPRLYQSKVGRISGKIGVVLHSNHKGVQFVLPQGMEQRDIEFYTPNEIEEFIDWMHTCDVVLSSAMHPHIVAIAYGIPTLLISFSGYENSIPGDGVKFDDFYEGVGISSRGMYKISKSSDFKKAAALAWTAVIPEKTINSLVDAFEEIKSYKG